MRRVRRGVSGMLAFGLCLNAATATAQDRRDDPRSAVRYARNAFEYRDFDKVVEVLWPWLHPPRIVDTDLAVRARELLGISLFISGREDEAREEFSSLLLLDPDHALDPFLVPPDVIQAFEDVKDAMEPTLRALRDKEPIAPRNPSPPARVERRLVQVPHPATAFIPFGVPQFVVEEPMWGGFWLGSQLAGIALNSAAFWRADSLPAGTTEYDVWVTLQYVGLGVALAGYVGNVVQGAELIRSRRRMLEERGSSSASGATEREPELRP